MDYLELFYRLLGWCIACFMAFQWGHARGERITMEMYDKRIKGILTKEEQAEKVKEALAIKFEES